MAGATVAKAAGIAAKSTSGLADTSGRRSLRTAVLELTLGVVLLVLPVAGSSIGRGEIGSPVGTETAVKGGVLLGAMAIAALFGSGRWPKSRAWLILVTLAGLLVVTSPFAVSPEISVLDAALLLGATVAVGVLAADVGAMRSLRALALSSAVLVVAGVAVERWFERSTQNVLGIDGLFGFERVSGVFTDPNTMGQTAAVGALSSVLLVSLFRKFDIGTLAGAVCIVGLAASQSRTAALGLAAGLVIAVVRVPRSQVLAGIGLVVLAALVLTLPGAESFGVESLTRSGDPNEVATFTGRTRVWSAVLEAIPDRPVVGHGAGSSPEVLSELIRDGRVTWPALHSHNAVLQVLLTGGFAALFLLLASFGAWFAKRRAQRQLGALVWLVIVGTITEVLVMRTPSTYWMVLAAVFAISSDKASPERL